MRLTGAGLRVKTDIMLRQILAVVSKDILLELRRREVLPTLFVFGVVVLVILHFSLETDRQLRDEVSPGVLWVAFTFAGILGLNRSFALERENQALEVMQLAPMDAGAIFLGKWLSTTLFMLLAELVLLPVFIVMFEQELTLSWLRLFGVMALGTSGFCAVGTLFSAVAINTRMRDVLLPLLVFPVVLPVLIAAVECTRVLLLEGEREVYRQGLNMLIGCNLIYLVVSFLIFGFVLEE